jgi:hypothetical protein
MSSMSGHTLFKSLPGVGYRDQRERWNRYDFGREMQWLSVVRGGMSLHSDSV